MQPISTNKSLSTAVISLFPRDPPSQEAIKKLVILGINSLHFKTCLNPSYFKGDGSKCAGSRRRLQFLPAAPPSAEHAPCPCAHGAPPSVPQMHSALSGFLPASPINNVNSKDMAEGQDVMASNFETQTLKVRLGEILQLNSRRVFSEKLTNRKFIT